MGREIRKVPADWEHPRYTKDNALSRDHIGSYMPLEDSDYVSASEKWLSDLALWQAGAHPYQAKGGTSCQFFWEYAGNPPDEEFWRARRWTEAEATHFQMYETVSEGTPLTPPMASLQELADYLVSHGDFWGQKRGTNGYDRGEKPVRWSREAADTFVHRRRPDHGTAPADLRRAKWRPQIG